MNLQAPPEAEVKSSAAIPTVGAKNAAATKAAVATFSAVKRDFFEFECFSFEISYVYYRLMWKKNYLKDCCAIFISIAFRLCSTIILQGMLFFRDSGRVWLWISGNCQIWAVSLLCWHLAHRVRGIHSIADDWNGILWDCSPFPHR